MGEKMKVSLSSREFYAESNVLPEFKNLYQFSFYLHFHF